MRRMRLCPIPKMAASCLICLTMTALWSDLSFAFPLSMMLTGSVSPKCNGTAAWPIAKLR